jgi:hypothetical protein
VLVLSIGNLDTRDSKTFERDRLRLIRYAERSMMLLNLHFRLSRVYISYMRQKHISILGHYLWLVIQCKTYFYFCYLEIFLVILFIELSQISEILESFSKSLSVIIQISFPIQFPTLLVNTPLLTDFTSFPPSLPFSQSHHLLKT